MSKRRFVVLWAMAWCVGAVLATVAPPAGAAVLTIQPDGTAGKDTYADLHNPDNNYGSSTTLFLLHHEGLNPPSGWGGVAYLQFDLPDYLIPAKITGATLSLNMYSGYDGDASKDGQDVVVRRVTQDWDESTLTWTTKPTASTQVEGTRYVDNRDRGVLEWDITTLARNWTKGTANQGMVVTGVGGCNCGFYCRSSDYGTGADRPTLTITYDPSARLYDNAAAWWRLDAATGGAASAGQILDYSGNRHHATAVSGSPSWIPAPPAGPSGGMTYTGALELDPIPYGQSGSNTEGFRVDNWALAGDTTLFARMRWDGNVSGTTSAHPWANNSFWMNGYTWASGGGTGWRTWLQSDTGYPVLAFGGAASASASGWVTNVGEWYDFAIVLDYDDTTGQTTVTFFRQGLDGVLQQATSTATWDLTNVDLSRGTHFGYEGADKKFDGAFESIALWNRALTAEEVHDIFVYPEPGTMTLLALGALGLLVRRRRTK